MVTLSRPPTIAELYLAFRQAKTALYFERRGVGLLELAAYEQDLPKNLKALQSKLEKSAWFDKLPVGETWLVPKRLRVADQAGEGVVRIGPSRRKDGRRAIDVQIRLTPHPEFAVAEVLYLWRFGGLLDALLLDQEVVGYRLDLRNGEVVPHRRWLFEYWPTRYQKFRAEPLEAAKSALGRGEEALIINGDLASFYDTVEPSFMLGDQLLAGLLGLGAQDSDIREYRRATASLLAAYGRFRVEAGRRAATPIAVGIPIGALTSRVVANLSLAPLDRFVTAQSGVLCYRRYVDDLVIVAKGGEFDTDSTRLKTIKRFLPLLDGDDDVLRLDVHLLGRDGSELQLQNAKVRVHHLAGAPGLDFVEAVSSDFGKAVSERRAFIDSATLVGDGVTHLIRAGQAEGSPLRVLRDADRARLERFALSTSLHSLERVSSLIGHEEAQEIVRGCLERVGRVLDSEDNWVSDFDVSLRLLKLAISTGDWKSATELRERMDRIWGTVDSLRAATTTLYYRGCELPPGRIAPWTWLRNYLHERRLEAISSSLPIGMNAAQIESRIPKGLVVRTRRVGATVLRRRAEQLAAADLRSRDREDDAQLDFHSVEIDRSWLRKELRVDLELSARLAVIDQFLERCEELGDRPWLMPAARLFLCTRPPSYFDIARRWLYRVEKDGFAPDVFTHLLEVVNAVRGTEYRDPVGQVIDRSTVFIDSFPAAEPDVGTSSPPDPRIILGNLQISDRAWAAAATRIASPPYNAPMLTRDRLQGIAIVLDKATRVARGHVPAVLVLPELSLPRRWLRAVSNHVVRLGKFGLIAGLEYLHDPKQPHVHNQVVAVLPGPFSSAATWPWTKRLPAREEAIQLAKLKPPVSFSPIPSTSLPRTVVKSALGSLSVLICSELLEARRVADLLGRINVVLCPAWNTDTSSYDHLIQSVGFQLHSIIAIANNGHYSDCRAWAPRTERWERDLCRLIERDVDDVVHVDIPLAQLVAFHNGVPNKRWRPLPPDWP
ncbi:MAG: RNA-directed DNA polymerase [Gammaproteobacteria bacterium]|nr:MAG: RNA-directed DNA polymerase [Gammaproteobacteria bacterium]